MIKNIVVTEAHIRETLNRELERATADAGIVKSYCSSCPVANAVDEALGKTPLLLYIDVDGLTVNLGFGTDGSSTGWLNANLPEEIQEWISSFDGWLKDENGLDVATHLRAAEIQRMLDSPDSWPTPPAPFELTFVEEQ